MTIPRSIVLAALLLAVALWFGPNRYQYLTLRLGEYEVVVRGHTATGDACIMAGTMIANRYDAAALARIIPHQRGKQLPLC